MTIDFQKAAKYNNKERKAKRFTNEHIAKVVAFWQSKHGLSSDGECGPMTQSSLDANQPESDTFAGNPETCVVESLGKGRYRIRREQ